MHFFLSNAQVQAAPDANKIFTVNSVADEIDELKGDGKCNSFPSQRCTLRAAVMEASALGGNVTIILPPDNNYVLQRAGIDDSGQNGDLDVTGNVNLTVLGGNVYSTVIDGNQLDRLFQMESGAHVTFKYLTLQNGNAANGGGAIHSGNASVTLERVIVRNNKSSSLGGGIFSQGGALIVRDSMIRGNQAGNNSDGGGIYNGGAGASLLVNAAVYDNFAGADGAGIFNQGTMTLINTTVTTNRANQNGGGIFNSGTLTLANATLSENVADADATDNGDGGGAFNANGATITVRNSIFTANSDLSPSQGFGRPLNCSGAFTSQGYNVISVKDGCTGFTNGVNGDKTGTWLFPVYTKLNPLGISGVRGRYDLMSDSPAVNAGNPNGCLDENNNALLFDTDYAARPVNGCDMGATEYGAAFAPPQKPDLFLPTNGAKVKATKVKLQWQDNQDSPVTHTIVVRQDSAKGAKVMTAKNVTGFELLTKKLEKGKTYFWNVKTCNSAGCAKSAWSKFAVTP